MKKENNITFKGRTSSPTKLYKSITGNNEYNKVCDYLLSMEGVKTMICRGCGVSFIYDDKGGKYTITRNMTLNQVKDIEKRVREINNLKK